MASNRMTHKPLQLTNELYEKLRRLAKFRGKTIPELLKEFLEDVDELEQDEIGFYET